jgi:hypothetical protein
MQRLAGVTCLPCIIRTAAAKRREIATEWAEVSGPKYPAIVAHYQPMSIPNTRNSPPYEGGVAAALGGRGGSLHYSLFTIHYSLFTIHYSPHPSSFIPHPSSFFLSSFFLSCGSAALCAEKLRFSATPPNSPRLRRPPLPTIHHSQFTIPSYFLPYPLSFSLSPLRGYRLHYKNLAIAILLSSSLKWMHGSPRLNS